MILNTFEVDIANKYRSKNLRYFGANFGNPQILWFVGPISKEEIIVYIDHFFVGELGRVPICHHGLPLAPKLVGNKETEGTPGSRA